ncbi:IclR family transcriptional regulator [Rhodobium gokarnense]|uniref:DNA-binding IclR family transcriptional regulator n=1 Tax=Rhodobium gokarnense TaxID=364296 RepID=A0ABT3HF46_9HYPH|nr:IclR family transcriptional regulator [Rhodobium gokarnense]MCW2309033.1 DNA-binding IclR family transcriptional regulator [Rhodobium gokarnense]
MATTKDATGSQSIERATSLLAIVAEHHRSGASLGTLVSASGLTRATVRRLLVALMRADLVDQDEDTRQYRLGAGCYILGVIASDRFGLHPLAHASVIRLARASEDTAFFSLRRGDHTTCLIREDGQHPIRSHVLSVGQFHPLGVAAHGIAILAALPDDEMNAVIEANTPVYRERYPMLTDELLRQVIAETRERGFALNPGIFHPGSWAIGVAVRNADGVPVGGLSIGSIEQRLQGARQQELAELLRTEANTIEAKLARQVGKVRRGAPARPAKQA